MEAETNVEQKVLEYIPDPVVKNCPKCDSVMHWCHKDRQSGRTQAGNVYRGCMAKGKSHPEENSFVCLWCCATVPD